MYTHSKRLPCTVTSKIQTPPPKPYGPQRKPVFLKLPFISDKISRHIKSVCTNVTQRYFPALQPIVLHTTTTIPQKSPKDPLPKIAKSNVIYHFKCSCGSSYIGKTSRRLGDRMKEHIPMWIQKGQTHPPPSNRPPSSAIARHLLSCSTFDPSKTEDSFSILHSCAAGRPDLLGILEALEIAIKKPDLCAQKEFVTQLTLPWLKSTVLS